MFVHTTRAHARGAVVCVFRDGGRRESRPAAATPLRESPIRIPSPRHQAAPRGGLAAQPPPHPPRRRVTVTRVTVTAEF